MLFYSFLLSQIRVFVKKEIIQTIEKAILRLEFEPDAFLSVSQELIALLPWELPIQEFTEEITDPVIRSKSRNLLRDFNFSKVSFHLHQIQQNKSNSYNDLVKSLFLVATLENEKITWKSLQLAILATENAIRSEWEKENPDDKSKILIFIKHINNAMDDFLQRIYADSKGRPLSAGIFYLLVANKLGFPLYGVNFPFHFLVFYDSPDFKTWIDPLNDGMFLNKIECDAYLKLHGFETHADFFRKAGTISILKRMFVNMIHFYKKANDDQLLNIMQQQLEILIHSSSGKNNQ